jgi:hypothetical protein
VSKQVLSRPCVTDLSFQVFDRAIHPELVETVQFTSIDRDGCRLQLRLTPAGHMLEWHRGETTIVEILADQAGPLPEQRLLFAHRVGGERSECHRLAEGVSYQTCFQLERLPAQYFFHVHDELRSDGEKNGVLHLLRPLDRLGLSPVSYVDLQARPGSMVIHSYHTYPEEYAVVKVQSLIEFGGE